MCVETIQARVDLLLLLTTWAIACDGGAILVTLNFPPAANSAAVCTETKAAEIVFRADASAFEAWPAEDPEDAPAEKATASFVLPAVLAGASLPFFAMLGLSTKHLSVAEPQ